MADALYIVDGSGFIFRAYHALPPLTTKAGVPTGAVFGFAQMLIRLEQDYRPSHLAVVFDHGERSFRNDLYPEYKAHRPPAPEDLRPQFKTVRRLVQDFRVPMLDVPGVEADDVIATLVRMARERGLRVVIVSSDKDLMQLVGDQVVMIETMKNVVYDPPAVEEKFGVPPLLVGDVLALMGDAVDNVPGVPGVGPKTAAQLVRHFGGLEALLAHPEAVAGVPKLRGAERVAKLIGEHVAEARLSRKLVALDEHVALPPEVQGDLSALRRHSPDMALIEQTLRELEMSRLMDRLRPAPAASPAAAATGSGPGADAGAGLEAGAPAPPATATILDLEELSRRVGAFLDRGEVGLVVETVGEGREDPIVGVALAADGLDPIYLPVGHRYLGAPAQPSIEEALPRLAPLLGARVRKHVHGQKRARIAFARHGATLDGIAGDPQLSAALIDPEQPDHLARLAARLGLSVSERAALCGTGEGRARKTQGYESVDVERAAAWAGARADATLRVSRALAAEVASAGMARILDEIELPVGRVLAVIEQHGVRLDVVHLQRLGKQTQARLDALEEDVRGMAGYELNLGSPKQLQELLFEKLHLPPSKKTKTGYSTDAEVLEELAPLHPIAAKIHEHRGLAKLKGTYIDALPQLIDPRTGRLHTTYDQTGAATGRISSKDPNLQNIPIRSELGRAIRGAFIADPGHRLIAADYSQIELRVLAHLSGDEVLTDAFRKGQDVHERTACEMFHVEPGQVDGAMRRIAKAINYGIVYGQTDFGLARSVGIERGAAKEYIERYFTRYAGVALYMEGLIAEARRESGSRTLLGRFRPLPTIHSKNRNERLYAERMARNTPIQGTAADLMKLAMIAVQERIERDALPARILLTVHDELVLEAPEGEAQAVGDVVAGLMEGVHALAVPLKVDVGIGGNWAEC